MSELRWMRRALELAARGEYTARPNPCVGCVLVRDGEVVGEGYHARAGGPHAEVEALRMAGDRARGATAYLNLEPCAHHGRTPPCADALIAAGVRKVVAALRDPFPQVSGRGFEKLRAAGIEVEEGLLAAEARALNRGFLSLHERGRPWVRLKVAATLDGRTAMQDGRSQWITGEAARADNMRFRARSGAILTGRGTVLKDDPRLTVRLDPPEPFLPPVRVVLDSGLRVPISARVLDEEAPTLLVADEAVVRDRRVEHDPNILAVPRGEKGLDLAAVLAGLAARRIHEVQVEAGPRLTGAFLAAGLADELLLYLNPSLLGDAALPLARLAEPKRLEDRLRFAIADFRRVGEDLRLLLLRTEGCSLAS
ncbi:MAG: riboflavin biosynthesis protein RibD [Lysobacterales bacterium]|jgi:diaminohydroxyphosphoribosylaminopyrimidine deaminase/5-amino-6-(5-phosphoribosylamino)uracil reductase|nr:MAG: riboflavin biosynthesis protein RibD [Xanthomonadales bacterium]